MATRLFHLDVWITHPPGAALPAVAMAAGLRRLTHGPVIFAQARWLTSTGVGLRVLVLAPSAMQASEALRARLLATANLWDHVGAIEVRRTAPVGPPDDRRAVTPAL
jgi:hypothetical protein